MRKILVLVAAALAIGAPSAQSASSSTVLVPKGKPIQIALVLPFSQGIGLGAANAVQMAVEQQPSIHGFSIQLNDYEAPCGPDAGPPGAVAAQAVISNAQNVAVLGHYCSRSEAAALPLYEAAGIATVSGSVTSTTLPSLGPTVFNRTVVDDQPTQESAPPESGWYAIVQTLPSDRAWQDAYTARFGQSPSAYSDLYYDATSVLLQRIADVSTVDSKGRLVIERAALASALRGTTGFAGVSCTVSFDALGNRVDDRVALAGCHGH